MSPHPPPRVPTSSYLRPLPTDPHRRLCKTLLEQDSVAPILPWEWTSGTHYTIKVSVCSRTRTQGVRCAAVPGHRGLGAQSYPDTGGWVRSRTPYRGSGTQPYPVQGVGCAVVPGAQGVGYEVVPRTGGPVRSRTRYRGVSTQGLRPTQGPLRVSLCLLTNNHRPVTRTQIPDTSLSSFRSPHLPQQPVTTGLATRDPFETSTVWGSPNRAHLGPRSGNRCHTRRWSTSTGPPRTIPNLTQGGFSM